MQFNHFKTAAQFGRIGVNARFVQRFALYRRLAARALAELATRDYHLPGEHDQCDHSVTGGCSEGEPDYFRGEKDQQRRTRLATAKKVEGIPGLADKFPNSISITHDTFKRNVASILKNGLGTEDEGFFASLGRLKTSGFVTDLKNKAVIHLELPTIAAHSRNVVPDMRFGTSGDIESTDALLKEFPGLTGADIFYNGKIPTKVITHITDSDGKVLWSRRRNRQFALNKFTCAYCCLRRYHLRGEHDQ